VFSRGENGRLQTVCEALQFFLNFTGRWDERLSLAHDAEKRALAAGDVENAGWRAFQAGWIYYLRQQSAEVLSCADRAESHWREAKAGDSERATALQLRGIGYELAKDHAAAIVAYRQALELNRSLGRETEDFANSLSSLADAERASGDLAAAERDYREALLIARAVDSAEGVAIVTTNLAELALDRKDWPARKSSPARR
jgi:tetratricopeptide (TPR) repeat protein